MIQNLAMIGGIALFISIYAYALQRSSLHVLRHREAFKLESLQMMCAKMQAAHRNVSAAAAVLAAEFPLLSEAIAEREAEVAAELRHRESEAGCGHHVSRYEVYQQMNPKLPPSWPNWFVRSRWQ